MRVNGQWYGIEGAQLWRGVHKADRYYEKGDGAGGERRKRRQPGNWKLSLENSLL